MYVFKFHTSQRRLGKESFQTLIESYPDLLAKVETLALRRIDEILLIENREKCRKPTAYASINQRQFSNHRKSTSSIDKVERTSTDIQSLN
jgi:hypothetical protein